MGYVPEICGAYYYIIGIRKDLSSVYYRKRSLANHSSKNHFIGQTAVQRMVGNPATQITTFFERIGIESKYNLTQLVSSVHSHRRCGHGTGQRRRIDVPSRRRSHREQSYNRAPSLRIEDHHHEHDLLPAVS